LACISRSGHTGSRLVWPEMRNKLGINPFANTWCWRDS
jgi:hypothetical protein